MPLLFAMPLRKENDHDNERLEQGNQADSGAE